MTIFKNDYKKAVTLIDILIVLVVIGVIVVLTIMVLGSFMGEQQRITKLKKIYNALNTSFENAELAYDEVDTWPSYASSNDLDPNKLLADRISMTMSIAKKSGNTVTLAGGMYLTFKMAESSSKSKYEKGARYIGTITVDVDGVNKGKNEWGRDKFKFDVTSKGILPEGLDEEDLAEQCFARGYCTRWIVKTGNMDYLKADETGKCIHGGAQLSWTKTRCD